MHSEFDIIVVGAGFAGAVIAERAAASGRRVLVLERKNHIGGHCRDHVDETGIIVHDHGPHIFHTNNDAVWEYLSRYTQWYQYSHEVRARIDGLYVPLPFNLTSIEQTFAKSAAEEMKAVLADSYPNHSSVPVLELKGSADSRLSKLGEYVYAKVFLNYTKKQWGGKRPEELDHSVSARVPVRLSHDCRYFIDTYQGIPTFGYTALFESLLDHPAIEVQLGADASTLFSIETNRLKFLDEVCTVPVVYTGMIDELFDFRFGELPYRSLRLDQETIPTEQYQDWAVVNYPNDEEYTRITEYRHFMENPPTGPTVIHKEFPDVYRPGKNDPYYIVPGNESRKRAEAYRETAASLANLHMLGRLGEYRYYNMDEVAARALALSKKLFE